MFAVALSKKQRVMVVMAVSTLFFLTELIVGFRNHSLVLVADAFHVASDLIAFAVALYAIHKRGSAKEAPKGFSFGWQRAELLGSFFNGVFLLALGVSILLQTIERFLEPVRVRDAKLILIVGAVGLGMNVISAVIIGGHGHDHSASKKTDDRTTVNLSDHAGHAHITALSTPSPSRDLGILGVLVHLIGDAINNIAVMVSAGVFIATSFIYTDPIASAFVGAMILATSGPLVLKSGRILLESAPMEVDIGGVELDITRVEGIEGVHELHVWNLTQSKTLATIHVATSNNSITDFMVSARRINECLHHWGIHNATIQPEPFCPSILPKDSTAGLVTSVDIDNMDGRGIPMATLVRGGACQLRCDGGDCDQEVCCS